jgi:hypothetical protein
MFLSIQEEQPKCENTTSTPNSSMAFSWYQNKDQLLHRQALNKTITNLQYLNAVFAVLMFFYYLAKKTLLRRLSKVILFKERDE